MRNTKLRMRRCFTVCKELHQEICSNHRNTVCAVTEVIQDALNEFLHEFMIWFFSFYQQWKVESHPRTHTMFRKAEQGFRRQITNGCFVLSHEVYEMRSNSLYFLLIKAYEKYRYRPSLVRQDDYTCFGKFKQWSCRQLSDIRITTAEVFFNVGKTLLNIIPIIVCNSFQLWFSFNLEHTFFFFREPDQWVYGSFPSDRLLVTEQGYNFSNALYLCWLLWIQDWVCVLNVGTILPRFYLVWIHPTHFQLSD